MKIPAAIRNDAAVFTRLVTVSRATSKNVLILFFLNIVLSGFLAKTPVNRQLSINWHILDLLNAASSVAAISLVGLFHRRRERRTSGFVVLFAAATTGIYIELLVAWISEKHLPRFMLEGIPAGILSSCGILVVFTVIVAAFSESRQGLRDLVSHRLTLRTMAVSLSEELEYERRKLDADAESAISSVVKEITAQVSQLEGGAHRKDEIAGALRESIDSVIRPMSHELEFNASNVSVGAIRREIAKFSLKDLYYQRVNMRDAISPIFLATVLLSTIIVTYGFIFNIAAFFLVGLPTLLAAVIYVYMVRFILASLRTRVLYAFFINLILAALVQYIFVKSNGLVRNKYDADSLKLIAAGAFNTSFGVGVASVLYAMRNEVLEEARLLNDDLLSTVASARQNLWAFRKATARSLHGGVQARLQAAALRLARADAISENLLSEVRGDLEGALGQFTAKDDTKNLSDSLVDLRESWSGLCDIEATIPDEVVVKLEGDSFASECALEVINEAVTNAVKHGGAESVSILARVRSKDVVELEIQNERKSANAISNGSGLGSKILDESTQGWKIAEVDGKFVLTASIFIAGI